ncbi:IS66 family transposase zinc-finger binding domain-containing protein [Amycolatopsis sp. CA-230715]|uniref:IS66 family transposase zinc-finger binding domain-containing protein n=1 Tax=Amycolatopsis sp. CA-230715 TaxID=2745196 RepID=UPI003FA40910
MTRRQVVDLPEVRPSVTEHRLHRLRCRGCRRVTAAAAPRAATVTACYGPNVTALAAYLLTCQHIPVARAAQLDGAGGAFRRDRDPGRGQNLVAAHRLQNRHADRVPCPPAAR